MYSGESLLETYIEKTKISINEKLPIILQQKKQNLPKQLKQALKKLKDNRSEITIKPADKNLGIVIMDTDDYLHSCIQQLTDTHTYRQADFFPTSLIHNELQKTVFNFSAILKATQKKLFDYLLPNPKRTQAPRFYGIPKVHKKYTHLPPLRPIVSHSNSLLSPSAHFIDHVLQPLARSYPDYLHNSTSLLHVLQHLSVPDEAILVTIDVESLYPSIPQNECLAIVYDEMHTKSDLILYDPNLIIHLLHTNVNFNYFEFAIFFFQQIKGTAMGAAFSPL